MKENTPVSAQCPTCGETIHVTGWKREPRETTYDVPSWEGHGYRTFEPGPFADVTLSCGHEIHGVEGVRFLEAMSRE